MVLSTKSWVALILLAFASSKLFFYTVSGTKEASLAESEPFMTIRYLLKNLYNSCSRVFGPIRSWQGYISETKNRNFSLDARMAAPLPIGYLGQDDAIKVDEELFNEYKFSVDQLMELAGLSVASAIATTYADKKEQAVLIICGPGNNGGDGLVAARHLKLFGFQNVTILNARKPTKDLFINLVHQATEMEANLTYDPAPFQKEGSIGLIVDALFGFSFKPPVRPDFVPLMSLLTQGATRGIPIVSVDIPSGWDVEKGPNETDKSLYFMPDMLISLTAPKLCAKHFKGPHHFLGGRFVPKKMAEKYSMNLPEYFGTDCTVKL